MRSSTLVLACVMLASGGLSESGASPLELERRVAAQRAIEDVYWRHRIWSPDNPGPKPSLDYVVPESALRASVEDDLLKSKALERLWAHAISDDELQAEVERMSANSRAPEVLQEIIAALGNDPLLVAECLARPLLADRLIRRSYARDPRFHGANKTAIERSLARHPSIAEARSLGGEYHEAIWVLGGGRPERPGASMEGRVIRMDAESWQQGLARLQAGFVAVQGDPQVDALPVGVFGSLQEDDESFFVRVVLEKSSARLKVATVAWRKTPFEEWWARTKESVDSMSVPASTPASSGETSGPVGDVTATTTCTPDTWMAVTLTGAPAPREAFTAVWTGAEMIVWGGFNVTTQLDTNTGGRYSPATDSWTPTATTGAPDPRDTHTAVWTGTKMVIWGGGNEVFVPKNNGGRYDPTMNTWAPTTTSGSSVPAAREYHTAVWSGSRMVIWGGWDGSKDIDTGGRYDPTADSWATTARGGSSPSARDSHTTIWTGTSMVVWGGQDDTSTAQNTGGRYDPVGNSWSATTTTGAPGARWLHSAVWTGSRMIVWGGFDGTADLNTGGIYDPAGDGWSLTSTVGAPVARDQHVAVWTDSLSEMDVWGGQDDAVNQLKSGGRYNPTTGVWTAISNLGAPIGGRYLGVVWTGSEMITWGGWNLVDLNTGGRYCSGACTSSPPAGSSAVSMSTPSGGTLVSWTSVPLAAAYDLVRGSLGLLHSFGGDFSVSTEACLANDQADTSYLDSGAPPAVGDGFWYLVRGVDCGGAGTYDESGGSQVGSRDAEIAASASSCP
jgi:hypothetical protein